MALADGVKRMQPYITRLVESEYAQENLREALGNLRGAYGRVSGRKPAEVAEDKKLYGQVRRAATAFKETGAAVAGRRQKPKRRWPKRVAVAVVLGASAAAASNRTVRSRLAPGSLRSPGQAADISPDSPAAQPAQPTSTP